MEWEGVEEDEAEEAAAPSRRGRRPHASADEPSARPAPKRARRPTNRLVGRVESVDW